MWNYPIESVGQILQSQIPNGLTQAPKCGYALKLEVALLVEEVARVAQKSSCTAQSCANSNGQLTAKLESAVWRLTEYDNTLCSRPAMC